MQTPLFPEYSNTTSLRWCEKGVYNPSKNTMSDVYSPPDGLQATISGSRVKGNCHTLSQMRILPRCRIAEAGFKKMSYMILASCLATPR